MAPIKLSIKAAKDVMSAFRSKIAGFAGGPLARALTWLERSSDGTVLMLVMVFMIILSTIGLAIIYMFGMEQMASRYETMSSKALYLADGGIELAKAWLIYKIPGFPEWFGPGHNDPAHYRDAYSPYSPYSTTYPDFPDALTATVDFKVAPYPANEVSITGPGPSSVNGYYLFISTATLVVGASGSPKYTLTKAVSTVIFMSTRPYFVDGQVNSSYTYKIVPNSWIEYPSERKMD